MALKWAVLAPHPPLLVPEIGGGALKDVNKTKTALENTFSELKGDNIDTVILITPHGPYLSDAISIWDKERVEGSLKRFGGKENLDFPCDRELIQKISSQWEKHRMPYQLLGNGSPKDGEELDHGAFVPLYYFKTSFEKEVDLVVITPGGVDYDLLWRTGELLGETIAKEEKDIGIIISGDLSHRLKEDAPAGYHPEAYKFDHKIQDILDKGDLSALKEISEKLLIQTGECGYRPLLIAGGALNGRENSRSQVLSYEGPFGVGYMVALLHDATEKSERKGEMA